MSEKSWEERIADYIWKEFWIVVWTMIFIVGLLWFLEQPWWPSIGYAALGIALNVWLNWNRKFPKRNDRIEDDEV